MQRPRVQFTVRWMMIVIVVVAVILSALCTSGGFLFAITLLDLAMAGGYWWLFRGSRRWAARSFVSTAVAANALVAGLCVYLFTLLGTVLIIFVLYFGIPLILGSGAAWAVLASRRDATPHRSPYVAWPLVVSLALAPVTMIPTRWPLRLAFIVSRPALDQLADRVAGGATLSRPEWAGLFRVVGSALDPASGNVGLIINANLDGRLGLVRLPSADSSHPRSGPFFNLSFEEQMSVRWWYQDED